ncbi:hypothetical protein ACSBR1_023663 [Camellia fascicularis]
MKMIRITVNGSSTQEVVEKTSVETKGRTRQSFDQKFDKMNEALRVSCRKGHPVQVVSSSLLLVECWRVKIATNFCFCYPRKNHDENFCF